MKKSLVIFSVLLCLFQFSCVQGVGLLPTNNVNDDLHNPQLITAYYDLRDRSSYIQITNNEERIARIHVQIFQSDRNCSELNFFDELTPNDTVIYDLDNVVRNNGTQVPITLDDNSYGFVVVSTVILQTPFSDDIIGNFRIIDDAGYEYRSNMGAGGFLPFELIAEFVEAINLIELDTDDDIAELQNEEVNNLYANFNTVDNANYADVVGFAYTIPFTEEFGTENIITASNYSDGVAFDIFVLDMNEEPLSCDSTVFACGSVMNYGINEDYLNSRDNNLLCPGGGLADPNGGFISFENGRFVNYTTPELAIPGDDDDDFVEGPDFDEIIDIPFFVGMIGINNGNGTGSMDYWFTDEGIEVEFDVPVAKSDIRLKDNIKLVHTLKNGVKLYSFDYKDGTGLNDQTYVGVMAQDLKQIGLEDTVVTMSDGYYAVNYSKLGLRMATIEEWEDIGLDSVVINKNY